MIIFIKNSAFWLYKRRLIILGLCGWLLILSQPAEDWELPQYAQY